MYVNPNPFVHELDKKAESPAENELHDLLMKVYRPEEMTPQVRVGRFRLDVQTFDGIAWEVDGKQFHDVERDRKRDIQILEESEVAAIVRIPASLVYHHRNAVISVIDVIRGQWRGVWKSPLRGNEVTLVNDVPHQASEAVEYFHQCGFDDDRFEWFRSQQCVSWNCYQDVAEIGSPLAFLGRWHSIWRWVPESQMSICDWKAAIEKRTAENCDRWSGR